ncbi:MAG: hypothetical protein R2771_05110 [Saprospiraceae bacterium]
MDELFKQLERISSRFDSMMKVKRNFSYTMIVYLLEVINVSKEKLLILIEKLPVNFKNDIMSTYEMAINEGIEKEKMEVILKGYKKGISINDLSDITGLSISKVREIIEKDLK